ncbi:MAG: RDD family protein [Gammaproteobacteria bacterium]
MNNAGFFKRIFSLLYDTFLVLGIILVFSFILVYLNDGYEKLGNLGKLIQLIIILVSGPSFYIYFWLKNEGQTTGMQSWKIQLISIDNKPLKLKQLLIRCIASFISAIFFGLGYIAIIFSKDNCSWADKISRTRVVNKEVN